jgi:predicted cation transporter
LGNLVSWDWNMWSRIECLPFKFSLFIDAFLVGLSSGAVAGIVIGVLIVIALIGLVIFVIIKKKKDKKKKKSKNLRKVEN